MQAQEKVYVKDAYKTTTTKVAPKKQALKSNLPQPMQLKAVLKADVPDDMVKVTLTAGDVWGDGTGYQMLLDADANTYGTIIPESGPMARADVPASTYAEFEYKIPENADGAMNTSNIVINNSISIQIPAGVYDFCITNPTPNQAIWIASENGNINGRMNDYNFVGGYEYIFTVTLGSENDMVTLTIPVEGQALTTPENLTAAPTATTAAIAWEDNDDMGWNLRYRPYVDPAKVNHLWDLPLAEYEQQSEGFYIYDADGDGYNWSYAYSDNSQTDVCFYSASYANYTALNPDNWLITPNVGLGGTLKFKTWNRSTSYPDMFAVYVCTNPDWTSLDEFVMLQDNIQPVATSKANAEEYEIDLSAYEGIGCIAFRHYNSEDMYAIYLDDIEVIVPNAQEPTEWIYVNGLDDVNYTIEGLTPETEYEVQVQATGVAGTSNWTESTLFITTGEDPQPQVEAPVISYTAQDGVLTITATGDGFVMMVINDEITRTGVDEATYTTTYDPAEGITVEVQAYIAQEGAPISDIATETIVVDPVQTPADKTDAPSSSKENYVYKDENLYYNAYHVTMIETEPSTIYYRIGVMNTDGQFEYGEWMVYTDVISVYEEGIYMIEAYAVAQGKTESDHIFDGFTVSRLVDVEEIMAGKQVANVRYFNVAGQEMAQPNGLTIQVTTYTDGTTSAVKVVK